MGQHNFPALPPQPAEIAIGVAAADIHHHLVTAPDGKRVYRLSVWTPPLDPAPPTGYPLLLMLDGAAVFDSLTRTQAALPPGRSLQAVVVGVDHDDAKPFDPKANLAARSYDYTPPSPGADAPRGAPNNPDAVGWAKRGGGADHFLDLLLQQVLPLVQARYPVDPGNRNLYGHSYGGLFVLHAALTRPQAFQRYVAASPSIWWNDHIILQALASPAPVLPAGIDVTVMAGAEAKGQDDAPGSPESVVRALSRITHVRADLQVFPGLGHGAMLPASLAATLQRYVR